MRSASDQAQRRSPVSGALVRVILTLSTLVMLSLGAILFFETREPVVADLSLQILRAPEPNAEHWQLARRQLDTYLQAQKLSWSSQQISDWVRVETLAPLESLTIHIEFPGWHRARSAELMSICRSYALAAIAAAHPSLDPRADPFSDPEKLSQQLTSKP